MVQHVKYSLEIKKLKSMMKVILRGDKGMVQHHEGDI